MKKIKMIATFFDHIVFQSVTLFFMIFVTGLFLSNIVGTYKYFTLSEKLLLNIPGIDNSAYVMRISLGDKIDPVIQKTKDMTAVSDVYICKWPYRPTKYMDKDIRVSIFSEEIINGNTQLKMSKKGFTPEGIDEKGRLQCVSASAVFDNIQLNTEFTIDYGESKIKAILIGKVKRPYYFLSFTKSSNKMSSEQMFLPSDTLILKETKEVEELFGSLVTNPGFIVVFKDGADNKDKKVVYEYIEDNMLIYAETKDIIANTKEVNNAKLSEMMPLPAFLFIISTSLTFCLSVLFLYKKMTMFSVFYLCGCSKRLSYCIMMTSLGLISILATGLNMILVLANSFALSFAGYSKDNFVADSGSYLLLVCYMLLLITIIIATSVMIYRKITPMNIRREVEL